MIHFILNNKDISFDLSPGITLLDIIRYHQNLKGTKIGCREGDCGACTVLTGEIINDHLRYRSVTSCLMPLANANGKHVVTVEGINMNGLNPVQQAMSDHAATQCGFCTPGFIMSLAGFVLQNKNADVIASIDGNICRCTGYKSIERAGEHISKLLSTRGDSDPVQFAVENKFVPEYFSGIKIRLGRLSLKSNGSSNQEHSQKIYVGGGTDLYVQRHDEMAESNSEFLSVLSQTEKIYQSGIDCVIHSSATVTDLIESDIIKNIFPSFLKYSKLVSSTPIRNMATIGGNLINASPIGDFTIFFLALNARIILTNDETSREVELKNFYKGYKHLDKHPDEFVKEIRFAIPKNEFHFNFEKVSKRTNLDIASVNSAISIITHDGFQSAALSAGGVGPIPMYLNRTSEFISKNKINSENIKEAVRIALTEVSPISDVRGSAEYKKLLLQHLVFSHFITLFPDTIKPEKLLINEEY